MPVSVAHANMINVYEICLNNTNYLIFNMQDFRYCLWTSILVCFGQLVSPPCEWSKTKEIKLCRYELDVVPCDIVQLFEACELEHDEWGT